MKGGGLKLMLGKQLEELTELMTLAQNALRDSDSDEEKKEELRTQKDETFEKMCQLYSANKTYGECGWVNEQRAKIERQRANNLAKGSAQNISSTQILQQKQTHLSSQEKRLEEAVKFWRMAAENRRQPGPERDPWKARQNDQTAADIERNQIPKVKAEITRLRAALQESITRSANEVNEVVEEGSGSDGKAAARMVMRQLRSVQGARMVMQQLRSVQGEFPLQQLRYIQF
jgi:hypothetical protein